MKSYFIFCCTLYSVHYLAFYRQFLFRRNCCLNNPSMIDISSPHYREIVILSKDFPPRRYIGTPLRVLKLHAAVRLLVCKFYRDKFQSQFFKFCSGKFPSRTNFWRTCSFLLDFKAKLFKISLVYAFIFLVMLDNSLYSSLSCLTR